MCKCITVSTKILTLMLIIAMILSFSFLSDAQSLFTTDSVCMPPSNLIQSEYTPDAVILNQSIFRQCFESSAVQAGNDNTCRLIPVLFCRLFSDIPLIRYDVRHEIIIKIIQHFHNSKYKDPLPKL